MVGIQVLSLAAFALGALAGPVAISETSQSFKIGVTFQGKDTLYLTGTAAASPNIADAISCTITSTKTADKTIGKLGCGPEQKAFTYSEFHTTAPLQPVASDKKNTDWSIGADNVITWGAVQGKAVKSVSFSRETKGKPNAIFAEVCSSFDHHANMPAVKDFWERGVAKAYFVES